MKKRIGLFLVLAVFLLLFVRLGLVSRSSAEGVWVKERMAACPGSPNCVSSREGRESHRVEALAGGDATELFRRAADVVRALPRTRVVTEEEGYLHAECRSALFRFVDDLELELDAEAGVVHVRSASRVGHSDLGVNGRRVERLRAALAP